MQNQSNVQYCCEYCPIILLFVSLSHARYCKYWKKKDVRITIEIFYVININLIKNIQNLGPVVRLRAEA